MFKRRDRSIKKASLRFMYLGAEVRVSKMYPKAVNIQARYRDLNDTIEQMIQKPEYILFTSPQIPNGERNRTFR